MPNDVMNVKRLAARYSYLEREGMLPLPLKDRVTIVVELRHAEWATECIRLLLLHSGPRITIVAVPMNGEFPLHQLSEEFAEEAALSFLPYEDGNYRVNEALANAGTTYIALVEDSVMVTAGWLGGLLWPHIDDPDVQVVAPRSSTEEREGKECIYLGESAELSAYATHTMGKHRGEWDEAEVLSGSCLLFSKELLRKIGGFDASLHQRRLIIADWCLRARMFGARLVVSKPVYVHVLHPLMGGRLLPADEQAARVEGKKAYCAKWQLQNVASEESLPVPEDPGVLPQQPVIPLRKQAHTGPLVTAVVYVEEQRNAEISAEKQGRLLAQLQAQQSYSNIRWVWVRNHINGNETVPDLKLPERDALIMVQGEQAWLHALEHVAALYEGEVVVYLSASVEYDGRYIERAVQAVRYGSADMVVSLPSDNEEWDVQSSLLKGSQGALPLERIAHRHGVAPGRIAGRQPGRRSLLLYPAEALSIGYIAGVSSGHEAVQPDRKEEQV